MVLILPYYCCVNCYLHTLPSPNYKLTMQLPTYFIATVMLLCVCFLYSCTHLEFSGEGSCSKYSLSLNHMTFKYTSDKNFTELLDLLQSVEILLRNSITSGCTSPTGIFLCNLVFIPCNLTTGTPRPLCSRSCSIFSSACTIEFDTVLTLAGALGIPFTNDCENTFHHINARYGYPNSSNDFEDDCYDLPNLPDGMRFYNMHACEY